jgi:hypothetical protein
MQGALPEIDGAISSANFPAAVIARRKSDEAIHV